MTGFQLQKWRPMRMVRRPPPSSKEEDSQHSLSLEDLTGDSSSRGTSLDSLIRRKNYTAVSQIALLHRKEIELGRLLGQGSFAQVHELTDVHLRADLGKSFSAVGQGPRQHLETSFHIKGGVVANGGAVPSKPRYVVKHLHRKFLTRPRQFRQESQSLVTEATIMAQLNHEHIISVKAVSLGCAAAFLESRRIDAFFVIEEQLSSTLTSRIQSWQQSNNHQARPLDWLALKLQLMLQLASALDYLHDRRFIYRDCKPDNIGFLSDGASDCLKLFDFGLCRRLPELNHDGRDDAEQDDETFLMSMAGTTRYMASEVLSGGPYNLKADVYSFAMVFYEVLAEKKPFANFGFRFFEESVCRLGKRPELPPELPLGVACLLEGAWCKDVAERLSMKDCYETLSLLVRAIGATQLGQLKTNESY